MNEKNERSVFFFLFVFFTTCYLKNGSKACTLVKRCLNAAYTLMFMCACVCVFTFVCVCVFFRSFGSCTPFSLCSFIAFGHTERHIHSFTYLSKQTHTDIQQHCATVVRSICVFYVSGLSIFICRQRMCCSYFIIRFSWNG